MQITSTSPNFTSRNAYIRRADDIVRKVRNEFPMFSPTNAWDNWRVLKVGNPIREKAKRIISRKTKIIDNYRKSNTLTKDNPCFFNIFENIWKTKVGNCRESSIATLGTCIANGYPAVKISPTIEMHVIDKNGQDIFSCNKFCDHAVVMAKMDAQNCNSSADVAILDTWQGKAMGYREALTKYKDEYMDGDFLPALLRTHKELIKEKGLFKGLAIILDSKTTYKPEMKFGAMKTQELTGEQMQEWGEKIAEKFPQILMSEK